MDKNISELIEYLDKKFLRIDGRFEETVIRKDLEKFATKKDLEKFSTKKDLQEITAKLVTLEEFDSFRNEMRKEIGDIKENLNILTSAVDKSIKLTERYYQEMLMLGHKVDRQEKWILQLAKKLEVKLEY